MTPQHVVAYLRFQLERHGWPAAVGIALIVSAVGLQFFGVQQARSRAAEVRAEAVAQHQRQAQRPTQDETASKRLATFYASLPTSDDNLEAIETIHQAAEKNGVKLVNGEYRLVRDGSARLLRYQITLPARASYPHLRAWLAEVMNAVPTAALTDISFQRDDIGSDSVVANVRLTLFLRAP
jgi:hypothetical protein